MISGNNIICFGFAEWDNPYKTNQHHLMSRLSKHNRVLFIESLGLRQPTLQPKDTKRIVKRLISWIKGVKKVSETLYIFSPLVLPFHKYLFVRVFNKIFLHLQLKIVVSKYNFKNPIIWSYIPNAIDFLGVWQEKISVYHCVDELSANSRIPEQVVKRMEEEFIKKVDVTFVTAKTLFEEKRKYSDSVFYMPNVADFEHFNKALLNSTVIEPDVSAIPSPRLGFIGAISNYKIDFELVDYLARKHAEWSFVFIGETGEGEKTVDLTRIKENQNVYFLGGKDYTALPGCIKGFDICLLPNRLNEYTRNMFPMKFFEYLASGKPVVSTELQALREFY